MQVILVRRISCQKFQCFQKRNRFDVNPILTFEQHVSQGVESVLSQELSFTLGRKGKISFVAMTRINFGNNYFPQLHQVKVLEINVAPCTYQTFPNGWKKFSCHDEARLCDLAPW
jgi:hypothetical protein